MPGPRRRSISVCGQAQQRLDPPSRCWILHSYWLSSRRGTTHQAKDPCRVRILVPNRPLKATGSDHIPAAPTLFAAQINKAFTVCAEDLAGGA